MEFKLNDYHRNVPDEELLKDILRIAKEMGKDSITQKEYLENGGKYHWSTIQKRFGGWINALKRCGLCPEAKQYYAASATVSYLRIETAELIADLQSVSTKLRKQTFTCTEYCKNGKFSRDVMFRRFTSWNNALIAAGLVPFEVPSGKRVSEYDAIEEIERIWTSLGRQPTTTDIKNGISKYSLHVYERRFGSWRKALDFFVSYMNGEQEVEKPEESNDVEIKLPDDFKHYIESNELSHKTKRDINLRMRFLVMKRDNFKCCMCGRSPATTPGLELHIDHIIPWSKGGETVIDNLQTLCSDCNLGKSDIEL